MLALVFLGSPGCGCSDDLPDTPGEEERECCCEFEWIPLGNQFGATVDIVLLNAHASLQAEARPAQLTGVNSGEPQLFDICVQEDHTIGATVTVEFRQGALLLGSAILVYDQRCEPSITQPSDRLVLTSTDCADECCCSIAWEVTERNLVNETVDLAIVGMDLGVRARLNPTQLTDVTFGDMETFQICLNDDHPVPATVTVEASVNATPVWTVTFSYQEPCIVTVPVGPDLPLMWSTDCGAVETCCCDFMWTVTTDNWGLARTVFLELQNATPGLGAALTCTQCDGVSFGAAAPGVPAEFTVCVPLNHAIGASVDVVVHDGTDATGPIVDRLTLTYDLRCVPTGFEETSPPMGEDNFGSFTTESCGGIVFLVR